MTRKYAADDASLNTGAIITSRDKNFKDLNLLFQAIPGSGDVYKSKDAAAVKQSIRNLVLTNFYERPFNHGIGGNVRAALFENNTAFTRLEIEDDIRRVISNYEPRAKLKRVKITATGHHSVDILIEAQVISVPEVVQINISVERIR